MLTAKEAGRAGLRIPDDEQLLFAFNEERIMVTSDRDFVELVPNARPNYGALLLQRPLSTGELIAYLEYAAKTFACERTANTVIFCFW